MNFGAAIESAKTGEKIARACWQGQMWVCYMQPVVIPEGVVNGRTKQFVPEGDLRVGGYFVVWTPQGIWQPGWTPSAPDMIATDWELA